MNTHILTRVTQIQKPLSEVFEFFSNAQNLNLLTPPQLQFKILTPMPIEMYKGRLIDYQLKLNGIGFKWKTEIAAWEPPYRFVDQQLKGPYKVWIHEHRFEEKNGFTMMYDTVEFLSPGGFLEPLINKLFIQKRVSQIFDYRAMKLKTLFKTP